MLTRASRPLAFSVLLHASVLGILAVLMFRMQPSSVSEPFIIDAGSWPVVHESPRSATTDIHGVSFTPVKGVAPMTEQAPDIDQPESSPPVEQSRPTRVPSVPRTPTVVPSSATTRATTFKEYQRLHSVKTASIRSSSMAAGSGPAKIRIDEVLATTGPMVSPSGSVPDGMRTASYFERLVAQLRAVHEKPAGLDDGLQARVEFVLRENGTLGDVRILESSGNDAFDASVLAAFRRLRDLGVPPEGAAGTKQVTFRTKAD